MKHGDVVQVSLIIVSVNSSTHLGRYTVTASNVAGTATASIILRLTAPSSLSTASYRPPTDHHHDHVDERAAAAVLQRPDAEYRRRSGIATSHSTSNTNRLRSIVTSVSVYLFVCLSHHRSHMCSVCRRAMSFHMIWGT